jgi:hypothetical protein
MALINPAVWGQLEKLSVSGQLPSTDDIDRIKQFDAAGSAATQRHYFEVTFDNCAGRTFNINVVDVAPAPKQAGGGSGGDGKKKDKGGKKSRPRAMR